MRFWPLSQITLNFQYKLRQLYHKLRQEVITNYDTLKIRCIQNLLSITAAQTSPTYWWLLQIALIFIINYGSFQNYYKLRQKILQITAGITKCGVITNCVVTSLVKNIDTRMISLKSGFSNLSLLLGRWWQSRFLRYIASYYIQCKLSFILSYFTKVSVWRSSIVSLNKVFGK